MLTIPLLLLTEGAQAAVPIVTVAEVCQMRTQASHESPTSGRASPGAAWPLVQVGGDAPWGWVQVQGAKGTVWLGPECAWRVNSAQECPLVPSEPCPEPPPPPPPNRPSYGGVFLGRAGTNDAYLGEGGQLSVGGMALLRVNNSPWLAGFSAAYLGGSRFERQVLPFAPGISTGGAGIGNVASIYTDVRHIPLAAISAYGWELWRAELFVGGGPSAHRFSVRRREQVSGVSQQEEATDRDGAEQQTLTTYTIDRQFSGGSSRWAMGLTAVAGALVDAGSLPFVGGHWRVGVLGTLSGPLGRQGCGYLDDQELRFSTVCVPLEYNEVRRVYYTQGKEDTDQTQSSGTQLQLMPVTGVTWSINSTLFFQF